MRNGLVRSLAVPVLAGVVACAGLTGCPSKDEKLASIEDRKEALQEEIAKLNEKQTALETQDERQLIYSKKDLYGSWLAEQGNMHAIYTFTPELYISGNTGFTIGDIDYSRRGPKTFQLSFSSHANRHYELGVVFSNNTTIVMSSKKRERVLRKFSDNHTITNKFLRSFIKEGFCVQFDGTPNEIRPEMMELYFNDYRAFLEERKK